MSHPATFFPVQLIEQVRTCWSRDEDVSGLEYRRFNDDDIKGITDVWLDFKMSNQHQRATSWLEFIKKQSHDLHLATLLRIAEELLRWHEGSEESFTNIIQLLGLSKGNSRPSNGSAAWAITIAKFKLPKKNSDSKTTIVSQGKLQPWLEIADGIWLQQMRGCFHSDREPCHLPIR